MDYIRYPCLQRCSVPLWFKVTVNLWAQYNCDKWCTDCCFCYSHLPRGSSLSSHSPPPSLISPHQLLLLSFWAGSFFFFFLSTVSSFELLLSLRTSQILLLPFPSTESVIFVLVVLPRVDETFHERLSAETIPIHCWSKCFRDLKTILIIEKCFVIWHTFHECLYVCLHSQQVKIRKCPKYFFSHFILSCTSSHPLLAMSKIVVIVDFCIIIHV